MRTVGLHLRIDRSLTHTAQFAQAMGMRSFQCFISLHASGKSFLPDYEDIHAFNQMRSQFDNLFLHASYFINPASCTRTYHPILEQEIHIARQLNIPYLILHPGMALHKDQINDGIDALARVIDTIHNAQDQVSIVIENTAQDARAVGSKFEHLKLLLERLDDPDRVRFCIDTAHAYAYGYDISNPQAHEALLDLLDATIGIDRIVVIHLNDTLKPLASFIDEHTNLGDGLIGLQALQAFVNNKRLSHIPLILELPVLSDVEYRGILKLVNNW
ncbi:MAG: deoxyribonuclease IV [Candidatus Babeliales bacterium]